MGEKLWTREFIGMGLTNFFYFFCHSRRGFSSS